MKWHIQVTILFQSKQNSDNKCRFSGDSLCFISFEFIIRQQLKKN